MNIITGKTLKEQDKDFFDMVSNARKGDIYLRESRFLINYIVASFFLVENVEEIETRFDSRDRILRGWRCYEENGNLIKLEKCSYWCSQLANTEKINDKFAIVN